MDTNEVHELFQKRVARHGLVKRCGRDRLAHELAVCLWLIEHDRDTDPEALIRQTVQDLVEEFKGGPIDTATDLRVDFDSMVAPE